SFASLASSPTCAATIAQRRRWKYNGSWRATALARSPRTPTQGQQYPTAAKQPEPCSSTRPATRKLRTGQTESLTRTLGPTSERSQPKTSPTHDPTCSTSSQLATTRVSPIRTWATPSTSQPTLPQQK